MWRSKFLKKSPFKNGKDDDWGPGSKMEDGMHLINPNTSKIEDTGDYESLNVQIIDDRTSDEKKEQKEKNEDIRPDLRKH